MQDIAMGIQSLSEFKRNTANVMKKLKKSGDPLVLTVNGKAEIVVQDAAAYQRLMKQAERTEMIDFLQASKADADAGRTVPAQTSFTASTACCKLQSVPGLRIAGADKP